MIFPIIRMTKICHPSPQKVPWADLAMPAGLKFWFWFRTQAPWTQAPGPRPPDPGQGLVPHPAIELASCYWPYLQLLGLVSATGPASNYWACCLLLALPPTTGHAANYWACRLLLGNPQRQWVFEKTNRY